MRPLRAGTFTFFPVVLSAPCLPLPHSQTFRVEFEVNIIVVFDEAYMVTENFPIRLFRSPAAVGT